MFVFRTVISTLIVLEMVTFVFSALKSSRNGKIVSMVMFILNALSIIAIWG